MKLPNLRVNKAGYIILRMGYLAPHALTYKVLKPFNLFYLQLYFRMKVFGRGKVYASDFIGWMKEKGYIENTDDVLEICIENGRDFINPANFIQFEPNQQTNKTTL